MDSQIIYLNPEQLMRTPAFSQAVMTEGMGKTIYVGGQNAIDAKGNLIGKGNMALQVEQVMANVKTALAAADASFSDVIKMNIYILNGQNATEAFKAAQPFMKECPHPPAITGIFVAGLARPEYLIEIEAVAFKPS